MVFLKMPAESCQKYMSPIKALEDSSKSNRAKSATNKQPHSVLYNDDEWQEIAASDCPEEVISREFISLHTYGARGLARKAFSVALTAGTIVTGVVGLGVNKVKRRLLIPNLSIGSYPFSQIQKASQKTYVQLDTENDEFAAPLMLQNLLDAQGIKGGRVPRDFYLRLVKFEGKNQMVRCGALPQCDWLFLWAILFQVYSFPAIIQYSDRVAPIWVCCQDGGGYEVYFFVIEPVLGWRLYNAYVSTEEEGCKYFEAPDFEAFVKECSRVGINRCRTAKVSVAKKRFPSRIAGIRTQKIEWRSKIKNIVDNIINGEDGPKWDWN
jgi:hypothetical protein